MGVTIYLDDERELPDHFPKDTIVCRNYFEAVKAVRDANYDIDKVSFDHDLGADRNSGYDFACLLEEWVYNGVITKPFKMRVHSQNPVGAARIKQVCQQIDLFFTKGKNS